MELEKQQETLEDSPPMQWTLRFAVSVEYPDPTSQTATDAAACLGLASHHDACERALITSVAFRCDLCESFLLASAGRLSRPQVQALPDRRSDLTSLINQSVVLIQIDLLINANVMSYQLGIMLK